MDVTDNELAYLETIHLFVELLDKFFGSVCELDLGMRSCPCLCFGANCLVFVFLSLAYSPDRHCDSAVFNFHKVFGLLDEFMLVRGDCACGDGVPCVELLVAAHCCSACTCLQGGEPQEPAKRVILERMSVVDKFE